ncbi:SDR family NAD(P)-dependent oxidoreductase [Streptomyces sp. NBC_00996]|uniref:SDR family NAD(P)-dependent oxidoreductase n=1 Tax=Streptomyces sp. NBC_00996 TaxID=2903710 RepID=UPI0038688A51
MASCAYAFVVKTSTRDELGHEAGPPPAGGRVPYHRAMRRLSHHGCGADGVRGPHLWPMGTIVRLKPYGAFRREATEEVPQEQRHAAPDERTGRFYLPEGSTPVVASILVTGARWASGNPTNGGPASAVRAAGRLLDITDEDAATAVVDEVGQHAGPIEVLISNAGHGVEGTVEEYSMDDLRGPSDVNVVGSAAVVNAVPFPPMTDPSPGLFWHAATTSGCSRERPPYPHARRLLVRPCAPVTRPADRPMRRLRSASRRARSTVRTGLWTTSAPGPLVGRSPRS